MRRLQGIYGGNNKLDKQEKKRYYCKMLCETCFYCENDAIIAFSKLQESDGDVQSLLCICTNCLKKLTNIELIMPPKKVFCDVCKISLMKNNDDFLEHYFFTNDENDFFYSFCPKCARSRLGDKMLKLEELDK